MRLTLVKQGNFLGTKCDFYKDEENNIYMSRTQIGYALQYKNPQDGIRNVHQRHYKRLDSMSIEVTPAQFERGCGDANRFAKNQIAFMYTEKGIYEICRHSKQSVADDFYDWVYETVSQIARDGFYIITEKDEKWLGIRKKSKVEHRSFTDEIQEFVEYAKQQGSNKPNMYYKHFTKLVNDKLGLKSKQRDELTQEELMDVMALERIISMKLPKLINENMDYHDVYKQIKKLISVI